MGLRLRDRALGFSKIRIANPQNAAGPVNIGHIEVIKEAAAEAAAQEVADAVAEACGCGGGCRDGCRGGW